MCVAHRKNLNAVSDLSLDLCIKYAASLHGHYKGNHIALLVDISIDMVYLIFGDANM